MTTSQTAAQFLRLCREDKVEQCWEELYSPECQSIEPQGSIFPIARNMDEIRAKQSKWLNMIHYLDRTDISDPIIAGDHFACTQKIKANFKEFGMVQFEQVCVYKVKEGKIILEQFFYSMPDFRVNPLNDSGDS